MSLRTKSSLDVSEEALNEISSQAAQLVYEYLTTITERPVRAENHAGKTTEAIDAELSADGLPLDQLIAEHCRNGDASNRRCDGRKDTNIGAKRAPAENRTIFQGENGGLGRGH